MRVVNSALPSFLCDPFQITSVMALLGRCARDRCWLVREHVAE